MTNKKDSFSYEVLERFGPIGKPDGYGWVREMNIIAWNGNPPKFDIRDWHYGDRKMSRGLTLTKDEFLAILDKLEEIKEAMERVDWEKSDKK